MKHLLCIVIVLITCFNIAEATDYYVDPRNGSNNTGDGSSNNPWRTISFALAQISGIDHTIHVSPGTLNTIPDNEGWTEIFPIFMENSVSIVGSLGADSTVLDAQGIARVVHCDGITDTATVLQGFTITGGSDDGIYMNNSFLQVIENKIIGNTGTGIYGVNSSPQIINNTVENNTLSDGSTRGGGIFIVSGSPWIENNIIRYNSLSSGGTGTLKGAGIGCQTGSPVILDNEISYNEIDGWDASGGGIYCSSGNPVIKRNRISHNRASASFHAWGGGIYCGSGNAVIEDNIIMNNEIDAWLTLDGGGIYCNSDSVTVVANTIEGNIGYGIYNVSDFSITKLNHVKGNTVDGLYNSVADSVTFNVIEYNSENGISCNSSSAVIENNTISRNGKSGIYTTMSGQRIVNNIFFENADYAVEEMDADSDPDSCIFNDYYGNVKGLYYNEGLSPITTITALHALVPECRTDWYPENSIDLDPLFVYVSEDSLDYHLQETSPCINRGHPYSPLDPDGTRADMGAFYFEMLPLTISGDVTYCMTNRSVADVTMTLSGDSVGSVNTDENGYYEFTDLQNGLDYMVTPSKIDDIGPFSISCYDAALIARIAVGLDVADHCDSLASDVDENGFIQMYDAALTCRFAVGLPPFGETDHTGEWRFEPASRSYEPLLSDQFNQDYVAALLGDVDGNWTPASGALVMGKEAASHITFAEEPRWSEDGKEMTTSLYFDGRRSALSFEMELVYETDAVRFVAATSPLEGWNLIENNAEEGRLRLGMYSTEPLKEASEFVYITWEVMKQDKATHITIERALVNREQQITLALEVALQRSLPTEFALHQNFPNPFNPETRIRFDIPKVSGEEVQTRLLIYNVYGQLVRVLLDENRSAGSYEIVWDSRNEIGMPVPSSVYLYILRAGDFEATKKMLVIR